MSAKRHRHSKRKRRARRLTPRAALLAIVLAAALVSSAYPLRRYFDFRHQIAAMQAEAHALDGRKEELTEQRHRLQSDEEVERIAREELGMVRPGEIPFVVIEPDHPDAEMFPAPPGETDRNGPFITRWWRAFLRAVRVIR